MDDFNIVGNYHYKFSIKPIYINSQESQLKTYGLLSSPLTMMDAGPSGG